MSQKHEIVRDCDRCARRTKATDTVKFSYDGNDYEIDVCDSHAKMLDREMRAWTRLSREIEKPISAFSLSQGEREFLRRPSGQMPARPAPQPTRVIDDGSELEPVNDIEIWPTPAAITVMQEIGVEWPKVVTAVRHNIAVVPSDQDNVRQFIARDLKVLVTDDNHVIGLTKRDPGEALPNAVQPHPAKRIERKGKRGGIGNVGPRTHEDLLEAIRKTPGWRVEKGGKHWKILGPEGQVSTLPITPSDWRGTMNAISGLRAIGLDLRTPTSTNRQQTA
jgi:hypothetical protein